MIFRDKLIEIYRTCRPLLRLIMVFCIIWLCVSQIRIVKIAIDPHNGVGGGSWLEGHIPENTELLAENSMDDDIAISEPIFFNKPKTLLYSTYRVKPGDLIGNLALDFGLNQSTLISINNITNTRTVQIDSLIKVPNQDGILYSVGPGDTLEKIAARHRVDVDEIISVNELFSDKVRSGSTIFIPGAQLDWLDMAERNGDLFMWPVRGRLTSGYGNRNSPFTGLRQFHSGIDISAVTGTPVRAAMSGRVSVAGWDSAYGNYVVISHHSGYRTLYAHLNVIRVKSGAYVGAGERIGDVGNTGLSTGSHLHFTVYKNGRTINPRSLMR